MKLVSDSKTEFMIQKTLSEGTEPSQFLLVISTRIEPASLHMRKCILSIYQQVIGIFHGQILPSGNIPRKLNIIEFVFSAPPLTLLNTVSDEYYPTDTSFIRIHWPIFKTFSDFWEIFFAFKAFLM